VTETGKLIVVIALIAAIWLFTQLSPVLMPFFVAALLAYLGDPLVDKLESWKLSRMVSVTIVFTAFFIFGLLTLIILVPILGSQLAGLIKIIPEYISYIQSALSPWLLEIGINPDSFNLGIVKEVFNDYWLQMGKVAGGIFGSITKSGMVLIQWIINLVLIPVLTFYLLRDWDILVARFRELLPRHIAPKFISLSLECDEMLSAFLRGQLMVMLALGALYSFGLAMVGLEFALLIGMTAGLLSFVPYLGLMVGIAIAGFAAFFQFHEWLPVVYVVLVFSIAQGIESAVLTPRFVGERIGLHPVAVIFAILAGGQLFGFTGVLLALPVAAVVMVLLRHVHDRYINSELYSQDQT